MPERDFDRGYDRNPAENYERFFVPAIGAPVARDLVTRADLHEGERVLDVACGTGIVTRLAAERVGERGAVTGVDINPAMLAVAERRVSGPSLLTWRRANAEKLPLAAASFDAALCQMSLQFMSTPDVALGEMRRVLVEGGRLALNVPGPAAPFFHAVAGALGRHAGPDAARFVKTVFAIDDPAVLERRIADAGFESPEVRADRKTLHLPPPSTFLWQYIASTPLAGALDQVDDEARAAIEREVVRECRPFQTARGMDVQQPIITALARKPAAA
ncbi:MAG: methyltransferase domain-containing protein [Vicinamibacterales bacterium]